jgi:hypothetical protein
VTDSEYVRQAIPRIRALASSNPAHRGWKDIEEAEAVLNGKPGLFPNLAAAAAYIRSIYPETG